MSSRVSPLTPDVAERQGLKGAPGTETWRAREATAEEGQAQKSLEMTARQALSVQRATQASPLVRSESAAS